MSIDICKQCNKKLVVINGLCKTCIDENIKELNKCKTNPYYFATKYLTINGENFTTSLTEDEFNKKCNKLNK